MVTVYGEVVFHAAPLLDYYNILWPYVDFTFAFMNITFKFSELYLIIVHVHSKFQYPILHGLLRLFAPLKMQIRIGNVSMLFAI